jgi:HAD superfamily hydrolase (TIGR01509 family)
LGYNKLLILTKNIILKAIIFDLNGVFLESRYLTERLEEDFGIPKEESLEVLKESMSIVRLDPSVNVYSFWKPLLDKYNSGLDEEEFLEYWFSGESLVYELIDFCKELRRQSIKVYILSNNYRERTEYYRDNFSEIFENVDNSFFSWETGNVKSDLSTYEKVLTKIGLKGREVIYFDDSKENVNLAKKVGINAYIYDELDRTKEIVDNNK